VDLMFIINQQYIKREIIKKLFHPIWHH
jgi:hypothetical protein